MKDFKYEQLKISIRERIDNGTWVKGSRILSERELACKFDISRITAKKAVEDLITEGILERIQGKRGTFVKKEFGSRSESNLVGVAIDNSYHLYGESLLKGIEDQLWSDRKHTVFCNTYQNIERVEEYFNSLACKSMDGLIFSPVITDDYENKNINFLRILESADIPFVLVDRYIPGQKSSYVVSDNFDSAYKLTETLLDRGHRDLLLLSGIPCSSMSDRIAGFEQCLKDRGITIPAKNRLSLSDIPENIELNKNLLIRMRELLKERKNDFSAIISLNTPLLRLADRALEISAHDAVKIEAGCFDAKREMFKSIRQVARIVQPFYRMGYEAAKTLQEKHYSSDDIVLGKTIPSELFIYKDI